MGSRESALRILRRAFVSSRTFFGYSHTLADQAGTAVGEMVRLPGSRWKRLRLRAARGVAVRDSPPAGAGDRGRLLAKAIEEAKAARLRAVALDVAVGNEDAIRFYRREGFALILERRHPTKRGLPAGGSVRMERPTPD